MKYMTFPSRDKKEKNSTPHWDLQKFKIYTNESVANFSPIFSPFVKI